MKNEQLLTKFLRNPVFVIYMVIVLAAAAFDLLGDRSFGALMLSALPIAVLALGCLLVGPWLAQERRGIAFRNWLVGATLALGVTLVFSSLGAAQAKDGELVFTYAILTLAFPASLVLPFAIIWTEPFQSTVWARLPFAWLVCVAAGSAEWWMLNWLREKVAQRKKERSAQA